MNRRGTISVIGLGRVGLPTGLCMAESGLTVYGIDKDERRIRALKTGEVPFYEPEMKELLSRTLNKTFFPTTDFDAVGKSDSSLITVNVPISKGNADFSDLATALNAIARNMRAGHLVMIKTTLPPGATEGYVKNVLEKISKLRAGTDFFLAYVPERLIEGQAIRMIREIPNVIGAIDRESYERTNEIFARLGIRSKRVPAKVAEVAKLLENYWRDTILAIANEAGLICMHLGVDALEAIQAANFENPWSSIPVPSPGIGGACLPKDPIILAQSSKKRGYRPQLLLSARKLNETVPEYVFHAVRDRYRHLGKKLRGSRVLLLGLAYKKGTDDIRNSPAERLIKKLKANGVSVTAYDPYVSEASFRKLAIKRETELCSGLREADCIILVTNHDEFKKLDPSGYIKEDCIVADFWGLWNPSNFEKGAYCGWRATP